MVAIHCLVALGIVLLAGPSLGRRQALPQAEAMPMTQALSHESPT
jgi:hypothetical protein